MTYGQAKHIMRTRRPTFGDREYIQASVVVEVGRPIETALQHAYEGQQRASEIAALEKCTLPEIESSRAQKLKAARDHVRKVEWERSLAAARAKSRVGVR